MSKDKGIMLIETLRDGTEVENFFPSEMAETILKTRKRFRKADKSVSIPKPEKQNAGLPEEKVIPQKSKEVPGSKKGMAFTREDLGKLKRPALVNLATKFEVSVAGKDPEIAQRIYDKALLNLQDS